MAWRWGRADPQSARAASGSPLVPGGPRAPVVFRFGVNFFKGSDGRRRGPPSGLLAQPPRPGGRRGACGSCCSVCWAAALPQTTKLFAYNFMGVGGVASMIFRARRATRNFHWIVGHACECLPRHAGAAFQAKEHGLLKRAAPCKIWGLSPPDCVLSRREDSLAWHQYLSTGKPDLAFSKNGKAPNLRPQSSRFAVGPQNCSKYYTHRVY